MKKIVFLLFLLFGFKLQAQQVFPQEWKPVDGYKLLWIDSVYLNENMDLMVRITNELTLNAGNMAAISTSKPLPYCLCQGYDGKTFAELGKDQTFINNKYPGLGLTVNDTRFMGEFLKCIMNNDKPIQIYGDWAVNREITIPWNKYNLIVDFNRTIGTSKNSNTFTWFKRELPTSLTQAENMASARYTFKDGIFVGKNNQIAIETGSGFGHQILNNQYSSFQIAERVLFGMETLVSESRYFGCDTGLVLGGYNHIPALIGKTQSNKSYVVHPRTHGTMLMGIGIFGCEGVVIQSPVMEGSTVQWAIYFDNQGFTDIKNFKVNDIYQEYSNGNFGSFIKCKAATPVSIVVDGAIGHTGGILMDASECHPASDVVIKNIGWWKPNASGKRFQTGSTNGPCWMFMNVNEVHSNNYQNVQAQFVSPNTITYCPLNTNCGDNHYTAITAPR